MRKVFTVLVLFFCIVTAWSQVSITSLGTPYTETFTGFTGTADPTNWVTSDASNTSIWRNENTGSSATGGKYSYGDLNDSDRSLGFLPSSSRAIYAEISFVNNTGTAIQNLEIGYNAEQWRGASGGRINGWSVEYKIGGGSYVSIPALSFSASNSAGSGALSPNLSTLLSTTITDLSISNGETFSIRFFGDNGTGSGSRQGISIDDFSLEASAVLPISLSSFTAKAQTNDILLNWQTATEVNNDYMAVERSRDGRHFEEIGMVQGMGTTTEAQDYEFIDRNPLRGMNFYRLRQVDFDGQFEYHKVVAVDFGKGEMVSDFDIYPTVVQHELTVSSGAEIEDNTIVQIIGMDGSIWRKPLLLTNGSLDVSDLPAGIYLLQLQTNGSISSKRFVKE